MKFLLDEIGEEAINAAFVRKLYVNSITYSDGSNIACVMAELSDEEDDVFVKEFDLGNAEENFAAAKKYLAELVESLNGGQS